MKSIWVKKGSIVGSQAVLPQKGNPEEDLKDYAIIDSGCSGSMTRDKDKLSDFKEFQRKLAMWRSCKSISYLISQIGDKKHNVLFTDKECLILSPKFKFIDEDLVILRAPRKNDVYSLDLKNIIPSGGITCLLGPMHAKERTADKEIPLSSEEQVLHDELVNLMHQESLAKLHNDAQRNAFERHRKNCHCKGKECANKEPNKVTQSLIQMKVGFEAMQEELLQFKLQDYYGSYL
ncbi:hypothetical protein Tco_0404552 [Tanacetum coccineum]